MKKLPLFIACLLLWATVRAQVPYQRIVSAKSEPGNWLTYSGNYHAHRFSPLTQITPENVAKLKVAWVYQIPAVKDSAFETSPIVVDGVMYVTEPPTRVTALDLRTGNRLWTWQRPQARTARMLGFGATNRGVAILDH